MICTCRSYFGEVVFPAEDHPCFSRPPLQDTPRQSRQTEDEDDVDQGHEERVVEVLVWGQSWDSWLLKWRWRLTEDTETVTRARTLSITYLHKPFVIEGDADGEDVVKENKSDYSKSPAYELHHVSHRGGEFL